MLKKKFVLLFAHFIVLCTVAAACAASPLIPAPNIGRETEIATAALFAFPTRLTPTQTVVPPTLTPTSTATALPPTETPTPSPTPIPSIQFAVIGDYGANGGPEADVAALVKSWQPDFIITTGDNNYPAGEAATIDLTIGQFYSEYISPYPGQFGPGGAENLFFPTLGNHDWMAPGAQPYLEYFTLPGNERYYDFIWGPVHFFALNSDSREPDGVSRTSVQANWLQEKLGASQSPWRVVYMHHPPYSSGLHGPIDWMRWPFQEWGATSVLSGHDHTYERILLNNFPYFINGLGGGAIYYFETITDGSQVRYNEDYGAMLVEADEHKMIFQFINRQGTVIDSYTQTR